MPFKPHYSMHFDEEEDTQCWCIYKRTCGGSWWLGLVPKGYIRNMKKENLPKPLLHNWAFTEWSWDTPKRPHGTDLRVEHTPPNQFEIWYSPLNMQEFLETGMWEWEWRGYGVWEGH